ncbi:TrkH family potassium uptake protein [Candidatus Bipolaricaulota bacterium]
MRSRVSILHYLGVVLVAFSILQAAPLVVSAIYNETVRFPVRIYAIPAGLSLAAGLALASFFRPRRLTVGTAMAVGALGWFALSLVGAIPYWMALKITYLDAFFETASGFTTTGATLLSGLEILPKSLLLWRALTEWIGGLGIFTLFLFVIREGGSRHALLGAEVHKAASERFSPGVFSSLRILWSIYGGLTIACALLLWIEGLSPFDAAAHALTTVSTGGFSTYDASIAHFSAAGFRHAVAIEYTILVFMFLGGTSFLVHWNALRRRWRAVLWNPELRAWIGLLLGAVLLIAVADRARVADVGLHTHVRTSLFQVVSISTTTGFTTQDLASTWFSPFSRQILLLLMLIGGCVGSTAGGLKVLRVAVLGKLLGRRLRVVTRSSQEVVPLALGRRPLLRDEGERAMAIAIGWGIALAIVWLVTTFASRLDGWGSLSAAVSALGNIGPHFVGGEAFAEVGAAAKVVYILAMIAGRLEILPFLLIFSRRAWR